MIKTDPVDPVSAAAGIMIAQLDSPLRRPLLADEAQRARHRVSLLRHAARLPLAIDADVERDGIMQDRARLRARGSRKNRQCGRRQNPLHRLCNDTAPGACRKSASGVFGQKKSGGATGTAALVLRRKVLAEVVRHVVERRVQLVADPLHGTDRRNGDERGD